MQINDINIKNCTSKRRKKWFKTSTVIEIFVVQFLKISQKSSALYYISNIQGCRRKSYESDSTTMVSVKISAGKKGCRLI